MSGELIALWRGVQDAPEATDGALLEACAAGDTSALGALFDRYGRDVHRFLVRLRGVDAQVVDDLVQETFLSAYEGAARFKGEAAVKTWLLAIASNKARRHARDEGSRLARGATFLERFMATPHTPELDAEQRELIERMVAALPTLSHELRVVFLMCDVEELRGVDVARELGIRQGTLYRRLHDARRALRAAISGDEP
jgi:RNA polymerase sigma-70 factor, ECF subfamily